MTNNVAPVVTTARPLYGGPLREALLAQMPEAMAGLAIPPRLAVVLVGNNPASALYVEHKLRAAGLVGIATERHHLSAQDGEGALHVLLARLARDPATTAILLQLPLPEGWDVEAALAKIPVLKDCDGLAPETVALRRDGKAEATLPATPLGVMRLLAHIGQPVRGVEVAVIGQGRVAGKPMAEMLAAAGATVCVIERHTATPEAVAKRCEVVISAAGAPRLVTAAWVKPGAVVVDIGLTRAGGEILGDVDAASVAGVATWLTPVPGGVGPMTIASLLTNVVDGARRANGLAAWAWVVPSAV